MHQKKSSLKESEYKSLNKMLSERFGKPIKKSKPTVGITDDRSGFLAPIEESDDKEE